MAQVPCSIAIFIKITGRMRFNSTLNPCTLVICNLAGRFDNEDYVYGAKGCLASLPFVNTFSTIVSIVVCMYLVSDFIAAGIYAIVTFTRNIFKWNFMLK